MADILFVVTLVLLFVVPGWDHLLTDGDTGWHIATGRWILENRSVPRADLFSFTRPGAPWYAWEWLADVILAGAYGQQGLKGVVVLCGLLICASVLIVFRYMLWRGAGLAVAVLLSILLADVSLIHYLARPHVFTLLLLPICLWILDRDRQQETRAVWLLVPIAALWANLHGGFVTLFVCLGLAVAGSLLRMLRSPVRQWHDLRRYVLVTLACLAATMANPYGYQLHAHVVAYLRDSWILEHVGEFQPPQFRSEGMYKFEVLLFLGVALIPALWRSRRYEDAGLVAFWAHAALQAARHIPIYMIVALPAVGAELGMALERSAAGRPRSSVAGAVRDLIREFTPRASWNSAWILLVAAVLWLLPSGSGWPADFPVKFPSGLVTRNASVLSPAGRPAPRLLSSDSWGGYLIYRLYPTGRVYIDGRSDFYGPALGDEYRCLLRACPAWRGIVDQQRFELALLPNSWPLAELLRADAGWEIVDRDQTGILFQKRHQ